MAEGRAGVDSGALALRKLAEAGLTTLARGFDDVTGRCTLMAGLAGAIRGWAGGWASGVAGMLAASGLKAWLGIGRLAMGGIGWRSVGAGALLGMSIDAALAGGSAT